VESEQDKMKVAVICSHGKDKIGSEPVKAIRMRRRLFRVRITDENHMPGKTESRLPIRKKPAGIGLIFLPQECEKDALHNKINPLFSLGKSLF
jgi:hypothetical protein